MRGVKTSKGAVLFLSILILGSVIFGSGCTDTGTDKKSAAVESRAVKAGDSIQVDYTGKYENGTVFDTSNEDVAKQAGVYDSSRAYAPLAFKVGSGGMIKGFDEGVIGMKVGEEKTLRIPPEKAYGEYDKSKILAVPLDNSTKDLKPGEKINTVYGPATVLEVNETHAMIDFNHRLAGKTLIFDVKLISIEKS
jgi:FKBP-type peptidyl-prolyl cis-trans isomerase 2